MEDKVKFLEKLGFKIDGDMHVFGTLRISVKGFNKSSLDDFQKMILRNVLHIETARLPDGEYTHLSESSLDLIISALK